MEIPQNIRHIHLIAICGTGMGSLAGLLKEQGYRLSGSDQNTYPPMSTELKSMGVTLYQGYHASNLKEKPDLVIVGNAVSKTNPEVQEMLRLNIPYLSMPEALSRLFITGRKSVVVTGTHGKTTTTALLSHLLLQLDADPSFLIGGILQGNQKNYRLGKGEHFVIEGDEYDTAFFDKGSKFLHYQPYYTLVTSLEFDHADIFRDLEHMAKSFEQLLAKIHPKGLLLACTHYPRLIKMLKLSKARHETYGLDLGEPDWSARALAFSPQGVEFDVFYKGRREIRLKSPMAGEHNVLNALAAFALLRNLGYEAQAIQRALDSFMGVKRRQEVRGIVNDVVVMDDFAHHPTAVLETIGAVRKKYPDYALWAVFEPRSNSSKRAVFQEQYAAAFTGADQVVLSDVFMPEKVGDAQLLDVDRLCQDIRKRGTPAQHLSGAEPIVECLKNSVKPRSVVLIMSNGGFGGIHDKLIQALESK